MVAGLVVLNLAGTARAAEAAASNDKSAEAAPDLSFDDLLPTTSTPTTTEPNVPLAPPVDQSAIKARRFMLTLHQSVGIALAAGMAGSMITGQLNYNDKFLHETERNSGRYELAHQAFVYPTLGLAAVTAGLAIFAPVPIEKKSHGFDRMTLHKIGQFTAFAGWAAQLGLGLYASSREGYANQQAFAATHLAVGYVTLAGILLGLGAIVF
jgi:hypothetical protein